MHSFQGKACVARGDSEITLLTDVDKPEIGMRVNKPWWCEKEGWVREEKREKMKSAHLHVSFVGWQRGGSGAPLKKWAGEQWVARLIGAVLLERLLGD